MALSQQQNEVTNGIQSVLWYTQISPPATPSKDSASTPVVQEKKRGIRHQWCEGKRSVMNNNISHCSVLSYVEGLLPLIPCTVYTGIQQQRHVMCACVGSGESADKHDFANSAILYLQKHLKNASSLPWRSNLNLFYSLTASWFTYRTYCTSCQCSLNEG